MGFFSKKEKVKKVKAEKKGITVRVLTVCGSGTVSSTMIAVKMQERFEELGYDFEALEVNPGGVELALMSGKYDFVAYTSPLGDAKVDIPVINAVGFMTGMAEDEFMEEAMKVLKSIGK